MITEEYARSQIAAHWSTLAFRPDADGLRLTIQTLVRCSRSQEHCRRICEELRDAPGEDNRWPSANVIRDVAWSLLSDEDRAHRCDRCGGSGYVSTQWTIGGVAYDFSAPCGCLGSQPAPRAQEKPRGLQRADARMMAAGGDR